MNSHRLCRYGILVWLGAALPTLAADLKSDDWPQFRGPHRNDISDDKGLLTEWPSDGPPLVWKSPGVGIGFSSLAIAGDQVFTMGDMKDEKKSDPKGAKKNDPKEACYLFALNRTTGKPQWKVAVGKAGGNYKGPRCTPSVDGDSVYALGQFGDLVCVNTKNGAERWRKNLKTDFDGQEGGWNYTESPLVDGNKLIVTPGGRKSTMAALDKKTGMPIWKGVVPNGDSAGYSSVVAADIGGTRQYLQLMANGLVGFSADKGLLLWRYGTGGDRFGGNTANIPTPIVKGDQVFAAAGYGRGGALVTLTSSGGKFDVKEEYWNRNLNNKHGGILLAGDFLYGDRDDSGRPWCAEFATGKVKWTRDRDSKGGGSASMTYADGKLYVRYANGWVSLVDPTDGYKENGTFKVPNGSNDCWAHPVVVGGKLYIRELDIVWCFNVKAK